MAHIPLLAVIATAATPTTPSFFARRDYTGLFSGWVQAADTNGDGIPDQIANFEGYIQVLFGNGDGTFGPTGANSYTTEGTQAFVTADLNGDAKVDLVLAGCTHVGGLYVSTIAVSLGNGDGTFQAGTFYQVPGSNGCSSGITNLALGDFNGDGILDVAAPGYQGIWLFTGKGGGAFNPGVLAVSMNAGGGNIAAAEFNGDHKLDLVVTLQVSNGGFAVLLGNGDGTFGPPKNFAQPSYPDGLAVGKLTKGGHPSIALCGGSGFYLYYGNGAGGFSGPRTVPVPQPARMALGDLNGDGIADLVAANGYVSFGTNSGAFTAPVRYPIEYFQNYGYNVALADLRNNGKLDIITDNYTANSVLLNLGNGKFEDGVWTGVVGGTSCSAAADYNRDGKPDLASGTSSGITILLGTGNASKPFSTGATIPTAGSPGCPVAGDLNSDGVPDLLVPVNGNPNAILAYLANGDGTFALASTTPTANAGGYVVLADFNHDGKPDFATSGNLIAFGNGDGTFQTPTAIVSNPPGSGFSGIAVGDINNDGWPDLVLTNDGINPYYDVYVVLNNQHGGFNEMPPSFGEFSTQPVLADLNGDGNLDLVLGLPGISGCSVYLGNGTGQFTSGNGFALHGPGGFNGYNFVADLNGDGILDVGVLGSNTLLIYLGEGGGNFAPSFGLGLGFSPSQVLVENLHGQSPRKGLPDIVAPDYSGGVMVLTNETKLSHALHR